MLFEPPTTPGGAYVSPPGDFSEMRKLADGSFQRTTPEQMVYDFDPDCKLISVSDRNGNRTSYVYDGNQRLTKIVDPVGLETTFSYNSDGKVRKVTDPANRETLLNYDAAGNLTRITDPDGTYKNLVI